MLIETNKAPFLKGKDCVFVMSRPWHQLIEWPPEDILAYLPKMQCCVSSFWLVECIPTTWRYVFWETAFEADSFQLQQAMWAEVMCSPGSAEYFSLLRYSPDWYSLNSKMEFVADFFDERIVRIAWVFMTMLLVSCRQRARHFDVDNLVRSLASSLWLSNLLMWKRFYPNGCPSDVLPLFISDWQL